MLLSSAIVIAVCVGFSKFATPEQREIYTLKRKVAGLESKVAKLSDARG